MKLGDKARSKITGVEGIITSTCRNLTGCDTVYIQGPWLADKGECHGLWVDVTDVEVIEENAVHIPVPPEVPAAG